jgi:ribose transport system substrate-binding protein
MSRGRFVAGVCVGLAFAACQPGAPPSSGPRIALVLKTPNNPFFIDMQRGAEDAAARLGVSLVVQSPEREIDVEKQMQIVENLIQTKVAALCITPSGSREIVPAIVKANAAGIPVVAVDTRVDVAAAAEAKAMIASFVGSDNYAGGRLAGEHLVKITGGQARVAVLEGIPGHETGDSRLRGFKDATKGTPGVVIVASQPANWERDLGFNVFQNMLQAHPDLDAVFACNDMMALGAIEAIAATGRTGKIRVLGFDAVDDARKAILAGTMAASVAQFPQEMGRGAVESAVKLLRGEAVPADQGVRIELVTKDNAAVTGSRP